MNHYYCYYLKRMCSREARRYIFHNLIRVINFCYDCSFFRDNLFVAHFAGGFFNNFLFRGEIWSVAVIFRGCGFRGLFCDGMFVFMLFVFLVLFRFVALVGAVLLVLVFVLFLVFFLGWSVGIILMIVNRG